MKIRNIMQSTEPHADIFKLLDLLHENGPETSDILETLSYYKIFHLNEFINLEERIISALGLFYKVNEPSNFYSFLLSGFGKQHKNEYGETLTPVQASVRRAIESNQFVSISAPTSAGKSYSIRDFIATQTSDAVIVVPSRALIAEYVNSMKKKFNENKKIMVTAFVDDVFTSRVLRKIFVLTPERARELFVNKGIFNVGIFFFDEAHISEEKERGVVFDVLVRRVRKHFPDARLVFAHPFVDNPDAQIKKHFLDQEKSFARSYTYGAVGKICVFRHANGKNYYFSPYEDNGHHLTNSVEFPGDFESFAFSGGHSVLIYVSKASIYNGSFLDDFQAHINNFPIVDDEEALFIIETVAHLLGADQDDHESRLVKLLRKGVVIHHGSVPLEVRFLVEDFIRLGFAKICFATSTLAQGVNMPFDIVWLDSSRIIGDEEQDRSLAFKNLIGRAGRLSKDPIFDFGYVFTKSAKLFIERINDDFVLKEDSIIELPISDAYSDSSELLEAIKSDKFDDENNLPITKVARLSSEKVNVAVKKILDTIYNSDNTIAENLSGQENKPIREHIRECFQLIFEVSLDRHLYEGEQSVFNQAISIFFHVIIGRSFREIVGIRYSYISKRDDGRSGVAAFSQEAYSLPNSKLIRAFSIFDMNTLARSVSYDAVVFDTYDYLDKVISFSLADVFIAAFRIYYKKSGDSRSERMIELLRYGTNNTTLTMLMRYGFPPESVAEISKFILKIDEENIIFNDKIKDAPDNIFRLVSWYLPE